MPASPERSRIARTDAVARTDLVALIGHDLSLLSMGTSLRGPCPFCAKERGGTLHVHPGRQTFHCFACRTSGDAVAYLAARDGISESAAAQVLQTDTRFRRRDPRAH